MQEQKNIVAIEAFIQKHHVLTLATSDGNEISACNLFYVYDVSSQTFIVASSSETLHIKHIKRNNKVAGTIVLETKEVGKIEGLQFQGSFLGSPSKEQEKLYFQSFPYALALRPMLWKIEVDFFKLTDNKLGFGKKLIWKRF